MGMVGKITLVQNIKSNRCPIHINHRAEEHNFFIHKGLDILLDTPIYLYRLPPAHKSYLGMNAGPVPRFSTLGLPGSFPLLKRAFPMLPLPFSCRRCTPNHALQVLGIPA